jgi:Flp pilus assembly protein TadG
VLTRRRVDRHAERGQALVEFALIAPLLFLLLFGVIQVGFLMAAQNGLVNGVRDTTRRAATYRINQDSFDTSTFAAICTAVKANLNTHLSAEIPAFSASRLTQTITYDWVQNPDRTWFLYAHVQATYLNPMYIPLVTAFFPGAVGNSVPLSASEEMRIENPSLTPSAEAIKTCT